MPELPEAETIARQLRPHLVGRRIASVRLARSDVLRGDLRRAQAVLVGRRVRQIVREGKRIHLAVDANAGLVFALGMTGRLTVARSNEPLDPHTHLRLGLERTGRELRFSDSRRFGGVWLLDGVAEGAASPLAPLGPDPMTMTWKVFRRLLGARRQIKSLLLDQRRICGLGNIYVDESLFAARIHPRTLASRLGEQSGKRLLRSIRRVLRSAIAAGGSTVRDYRGAVGSTGTFQHRHQVYGRAGEPCRRCGTALQRIVLAGRGTTFCPRCQRCPP